MTFSTARQIVGCCLALPALVACSASDVSERSVDTPPSSGSSSAEQTARDDALADLAASASERAEEMPTLLLIVNKTSHGVLLTSADAKNTATIGPGRSLRLASQRVCGWLPLTASTSDGRVIEVYEQPCDGRTWTIRD
jgi:hypothetical protein